MSTCVTIYSTFENLNGRLVTIMSCNNWIICGLLLIGGVSIGSANTIQEDSKQNGNFVTPDTLVLGPPSYSFTTGAEADAGFPLLLSHPPYPSWLSKKSNTGPTPVLGFGSDTSNIRSPSVNFKDYRIWDLAPVTQSDRGSWVERLILKPEIRFGNGQSSRVYYSMGFDRVHGDFDAQPSDYNRPDSVGLGITQSWYFNQRTVELGLGYEYEQNSNNIFTYSGSGHKFNLYGSMPLPFGLFGLVEAAYSRNDYLKYADENDLESERAELTAGLSSRFGQRFTGSVLFKYSNEEFLNSPGTKRSKLWGLNLKYIY